MELDWQKIWQEFNSEHDKIINETPLRHVEWRVQQAIIQRVIERNLTPRAVDCAYCHCLTAVIRNDVCINCGRVHKSHSH